MYEWGKQAWWIAVFSIFKHRAIYPTATWKYCSWLSNIHFNSPDPVGQFGVFHVCRAHSRFHQGFQCWDKNHFSLPIPTELDWLSGRGGHVHHWPEFCPVRPILTKYNENFHYCGREEKALKSIFYYSSHLNPSSNPCSFAVCFTVSKKKIISHLFPVAFLKADWL